jgi:hypothetical protein
MKKLNKIEKRIQHGMQHALVGLAVMLPSL